MTSWVTWTVCVGRPSALDVHADLCLGPCHAGCALVRSSTTGHDPRWIADDFLGFLYIHTNIFLMTGLSCWNLSFVFLCQIELQTTPFWVTTTFQLLKTIKKSKILWYVQKKIKNFRGFYLAVVVVEEAVVDAAPSVEAEAVVKEQARCLSSWAEV